MTTIDAEELGKRRQAVHKGKSTERFFDDPNEEDIIGAAGEIAFAKLFGLKVDTTNRPYGDSGRDFDLPVNMIVDVKTARKPYNLLVKASEIDRPVDIYVLARFIDTDNIEFLGWQARSVVKEAPVKDHGYGIKSHTLPSGELRNMDELIRRAKKVERKWH